MAVDVTRVSFVKQNYRYQTASDASIKTKYPNANEIVHQTNLSAASAATLATAYFNMVKGFPQAYSVEIEGVLQLEDLDTAPTHYTVSFPQYATDSRTFKLVSAEIDYVANRTKLVIRG